MVTLKKNISSFQVILIGFMSVVLLGALLLMLPISTRDGIVTPFNETAFTATSAVCVTGLVVQDTATYWSPFGQVIILILIQIGGLGVVSAASAFSIMIGQRIGLKYRSIMQDAISAPKVGGIVRITKFIITITLILETIGALVMMPTFCKEFGAKGIWKAVFHSVSAFCNAGFDVMGSGKGKFVSLTQYADNPVINITIMSLIIIGGIGFLVLHDIKTNKFRVKHYTLQSKIVLVTTLILILVPALIFLHTDFYELPLGKGIMASLFQSVTPRTAGFNTMDVTQMSGGNKALTIILMLIGGSPGSTAGGMKTTTITLLAINAISIFKRNPETEIFRRRVNHNIIRTAATLLMMYISLFAVSGIVISSIEQIDIDKCFYETASALGTVGLTQGITTQLGVVSQVILMTLMFLGRVGGLTIIFAAISKSGKSSKLPQEDIIVG